MATYFAERVWGISLRYELGGNHPLVGCSVPDFALVDGRSTGELLREGKGLLLNFSADAPLEALAGRWNGRISYVAGNAVDQLGLSTILVRPMVSSPGHGVCSGQGEIRKGSSPLVRRDLKVM